MKYLLIIGMLCLGILTSCNTTDEKKMENKLEAKTMEHTQVTLADAKEIVRKANNGFAKLFAEGKIDELVQSFYTKETKLMFDKTQSLTGLQNFAINYKEMQKAGVSGVKFETIEVWQEGQFIIEEGNILMFAGDVPIFNGKYLVLRKEDNGTWKIYRDIYNANTAE
jgi:ketosteroid isomerase-like protein